MSSQFKSKEEYIKFISSWKYAANHKNCKSKLVSCNINIYCPYGISDFERKRLEEKGYDVRKYGYTIPDGGKERIHGWLTGAHFILRNYLLGKELNYGFTPRGEHKLSESESPWIGFSQNFWQLELAIIRAKRFMEENNDEKCIEWIKEGAGFLKKSKRTMDEYYTMINNHAKPAKKFVEPFGDAFTIEDLANIDLNQTWEEIVYKKKNAA